YCLSPSPSILQTYACTVHGDLNISVFEINIMELPVKDNQSVQYCFYPGNISFLLETKLYMCLYIFSALTVLLTVSGNLFVIISISHFKQLHTPANVVVVSLAVADFLIGLIIMPFQFSSAIESCWYFGDKLCTCLNGLYLFLTSASVSSLVFISLDRYLAVCNPFFYNAKVTIYKTVFIVLLSWLSSLWYILAYMNSDGNYIRRDCVGDCYFVFTAAWGLADLFCTFILPFSIMTCLYARIIMIASRHAKAINFVIEKENSTQNRKSKIPKSEKKAAKTLGIVVAIFMLCWLPYLLMTVVLEYIPYASKALNQYHDGLGFISLINSGLNPIIYALFYPWFRKSLKIMLSCKIFSPGTSTLNLFPNSICTCSCGCDRSQLLHLVSCGM
uniref:G-protein coupled receptors family 1 profile domain-containing protein n=1 Tax=Erpetoichthys calabaricus TaxID=27687 RepID=A0A8C4X2J8_ERPCA